MVSPVYHECVTPPVIGLLICDTGQVLLDGTKKTYVSELQLTGKSKLNLGWGKKSAKAMGFVHTPSSAPVLTSNEG